ncbi:MAG: dTMP kinase [Candidatus Bathyarchaeia archaeon]
MKKEANKGLLICVEGIDGSGEGTNANILMKRLQGEGYRVRSISFPDYATPIGREIRLYLDGKRGYGPEVRQLLYVANRWERKAEIESWLREGSVVIANRYTPSGLAYGLANGLDLEWMVNLERGMPRADVTIVIDISVDTHFRRTRGRDVYETDREFMGRVRAAYLELAESFGWDVVDGEKGVDEVAEDVWRVVSGHL